MEEHLKSNATKLHRVAEKILATKLLVDFMLAHTHETLTADQKHLPWGS